MKLIVKRAFLLGGERQEVGSEVEIADVGLVGMLLATGKAEHAADLKEQASGPMTTDSAVGLVAGGKRGK